MRPSPWYPATQFPVIANPDDQIQVRSDGCWRVIGPKPKNWHKLALEFTCPQCNSDVGLRCKEMKPYPNHNRPWRRIKVPHEGRIAKAHLKYG